MGGRAWLRPVVSTLRSRSAAPRIFREETAPLAPLPGGPVATLLQFPPAPAPVEVHIGTSRLHPGAAEARGALVDMDGERGYEIAGVDAMPPFLMTVASDSDHWMFVSSTGGLTAGRRSPDQALFPYTTDDRLHDSVDHTGPLTILRVDTGDGRALLWQPLSSRHAGLYRTSRRLAKSLRGNRLRFNETNHDLELEFSYQWATSHRFGFVRRASLRNDGRRPITVDVLDGLLNLMPAGLGRRFQEQFSTLADGYKDSEVDPRTGLGIFRLSSIPVDAAEPSEALLATTVWSAGLPDPRYLLSTRQLEPFRRGGVGRDRAAGPRTARRLRRQCPGDAGPGRGPGVLPGRRRRAGRARGDRHRPPADRRRSPGRPRSRTARGQPAAGVAGGGRRWPAGRRR